MKRLQVSKPKNLENEELWRLMENGFLKKSLQQIVDLTGAFVPISFLKKKVNIRLFLPFYHVVSNEYLPHIAHLYSYRDIKEFKEEVELLLKHFKPISLAEIKTSEGFHLTFDDGLKEMYDIVAPI